jgi:hypothetical protein
MTGESGNRTGFLGDPAESSVKPTPKAWLKPVEGKNRSAGEIVGLQASRDRDELELVKIVTSVRHTLRTRVGDGKVIGTGHLREVGGTTTQQQIRNEQRKSYRQD